MKAKYQTYKERLEKALSLVEGDKPVTEQKSPVTNRVLEEKSSGGKLLTNQVQGTVDKTVDPAHVCDESDC